MELSLNFKNNISQYGWLTILLHWLTALFVYTLFGLGDWMVDLGYYHPYYQGSHELHMNLGLLLTLVLLLRILWNISNIKPRLLAKASSLMILLIKSSHYFFYLLLVVSCISGYLLASATGDELSFFNLLVFPSVEFYSFDQEEWMSLLHQSTTGLLLALSLLHALMALKHHFINKDETLRRMYLKGH